MREQRRAVERGAKTRRDGQHLRIIVGKRSGAAAEDVARRRLAVRAPREGQCAGLVDAALDVAPLRLRVDRERLVCVFGPNLIDVAIPVRGKQVRVQQDADVGADGSPRATAVARVDDQLVPSGVIPSVLCAQTVADLGQAIGARARDVLRLARGGPQRQRDGKADKIDVCDCSRMSARNDSQNGGKDARTVGVNLRRVEGELAKVPGDVDVGV